MAIIVYIINYSCLFLKYSDFICTTTCLQTNSPSIHIPEKKMVIFANQN